MQQPIHVLHVEDDPGVADLVATVLEREVERINVRTATDPGDGVAKLAENEVDCIVSDYDMPGQNGIEFLETVREEHPDLPFILYTGKGSEEVASEAISAGVTDYLQKESGSSQYEILANRIENAVEQYRTNREFEERDQQYRAIVQNSHDAIFIRQEDEFVFVNEQACRLTGYERDEFFELENIWDIVHPDDRERLLEYAVKRASDEDVPRTYDGRILKKGGEVKMGEFIVDQIMYEGKSAVLGTVRDITESKERERELRTERQFVQSVSRSLPDPLYAFDTDGYPIRWNAKFEAVTGYASDELEDIHVTELIPDEDAETIASLFQTIIDERRSVTIESAFETKAGDRIPYEFTGGPLEDADGDVRGVTGVGRDIRDRKPPG